MAASKILHGARAILWVGDQQAGIFNSVSYSMNLDVAPAFILGRYSAAELNYVGAEPVSASCSGFRVLKNGPLTMVPTLNELLKYTDITLTISDRATGATVLRISDCKPTGFSSQVSSRSLQDITVNFQGLSYSDEGNEDNVEGEGATFLPSD
jgi:hypothetical protein